jgi:YD repeat-containing protein
MSRREPLLVKKGNSYPSRCHLKKPFDKQLAALHRSRTHRNEARMRSLFGCLTAASIFSLSLLASFAAHAELLPEPKWQGSNGFTCLPFGCPAFTTQGEVWAAQAALQAPTLVWCGFNGAPTLFSGAYPNETWVRAYIRRADQNAPCATDPSFTFFAGQLGAATASCDAYTNSSPQGATCACKDNFKKAGKTCGGGKDNGKPCPKCGNPANPANGNKVEELSLYRGAGGFQFALIFNSFDYLGTRFSPQWRDVFDRSVKMEGANAIAYRPDGRVLTFVPSGGGWTTDADTADRLVQTTSPAGWEFRAADGDVVETYAAAGKLLTISSRSGLTQTLAYSDGTAGPNGGVVILTNGNPTSIPIPAGLLIRASDHFGRVLAFAYDGFARVVKITGPAGETYKFGYSSKGKLTSITWPGNAVRTFVYNEAAHTGGANFPEILTGIVDENAVRYATFKYDSERRVVQTEHAGGVLRHTLSYAPGSTTVVDPLNVSRAYGFQRTLEAFKNTAITGGACPGCGPAAQTYDANNNVSSRTDWNGNRTNYIYDLARNLETSRTEGLTSGGATTPQTRTISTQWHASFRLPTGIAEPLRITTLTHDANGNVLTRSIQPTTDANGAAGFSATPAGTPRTWNYSYNANGDVLTMDGPRTDATDVTTYTYYANSDPDLGKRGNVATITNAAGHVTQITAYNAHGQPLTIVDPNGLITTMAYDARQRLTSRTVGGETTTYEYDGVSQLTRITLPDGSFLSYGYDAAHRLTGMQDSLGNRISYTLDAMGNRTLEEVRDPANQLAQTRSRIFSSLNRLFQELGAQNQTTEYTYDNQGNVTSIKDPIDRTTANAYDALNRLRQVTDPASGVTQYAYNGLDALTHVSDPRSLVTGYAVDGLGNLNVQSSPDTGLTTSTYDAAGNLLTQTDAKGQVTSYAYDALNRVTLIKFHDGSKQAYAYDQGANAIGRLSSITETDPASQVTSAIAYSYDQHGRVTSEARTVGGIQYVLGYTYDSAGRLSGLTYPSGRTVSYGFDALGRVSQVIATKENQSQIVVQSVAYHPFGGVRSYTLGNGQAYTRGIDLDGRIASYTLGAQSFAVGYDAASRIAFISEFGNLANSNTYGYDNLDRLTSAVTPGTPYSYSYDAVGNRLSRSAGASTDTYAYSATSNRIASITPSSGPVRNFIFDPGGSTTADGLNTYAYDVRGRMVQATSTMGTTSYQVNALGQRIRKSNSLGDTLFHYDTRGRLIAETGPSGMPRREVIYLGDIAVGVVQ